MALPARRDLQDRRSALWLADPVVQEDAAADPGGSRPAQGRTSGRQAAKRVPAYRDFLEHVAVDPDDLFPLGILERLPETEKKGYIDVA